MRSTLVARRAAIASVAVLAGCVDLTGLFDGRPDSYVESDGLSYQVFVSESRYSYDAFEYRVRITNTSHHTIERWLPAGLATPRIYRDGHWSRPVWSPCHSSCGHHGGGFWIRLRRGEAVEGWDGRVWARDFASYGRHRTYHLTVYIDTGSDRFEVLGLPELHVY